MCLSQHTLNPQAETSFVNLTTIEAKDSHDRKYYSSNAICDGACDERNRNTKPASAEHASTMPGTKPPHVPCRHRRRDHSNVASDPFPTWHETPDQNTDAQLEYCVHFGMNLAAKRVSSMPCQTHAIATLALGVRGGPRQRSAKNDGYCSGAQDPLRFRCGTVSGKKGNTESELRSRIPETTSLPHLP